METELKTIKFNAEKMSEGRNFGSGPMGGTGWGQARGAGGRENY